MKKVALLVGGAGLALTTLMGGVSQAQEVTDPVTSEVPFTADNVGLASQGYEQSLDGNGGGTGTGNEVLTWTTHGGTIQQWNAIERNGDTFLLQNVYRAGECIKAPTELGQPLTMGTCNKASTYQRWIERTISGHDVFQLASNHDQAMQATGVNAFIILARYDSGNQMQQWSVESVN